MLLALTTSVVLGSLAVHADAPWNSSRSRRALSDADSSISIFIRTGALTARGEHGQEAGHTFAPLGFELLQSGPVAMACVGVLKNGGSDGLVRTKHGCSADIKSRRGLPYASTISVKNDAGETSPVMHACGHDIHMASWIGAASLLVQAKERWHGTLVFVGQPAEEVVQGADLMLKDGLLTRFPKPDFVLGIHDTQLLPAGQVGIISGPTSAASNAVDITFYGRGGHGAAPHRTIDPLLIAARTVVTLQTIVSREVNPLDPAVVTVGTFHAGTKRNIIANDAKIELTVRSYNPEVQQQLLAAIARIAKAEAAAAGAPREPTVTVDAREASEVVYNTPALAARLTIALRRDLGEANVVPIEPSMGSEDFGLFGRVAGVPSIQLRIGAAEPSAFANAKATGKTVPGPHSPLFAPDRERTIRTGVAAFTLSVLDLLAGAASSQ